MILAHDAGLFSLEATLQKLFAAAFTDGKGASWDAQGERLKGALVEWDCQDVLGVPPPLQAMLDGIFREYRAGAGDLAATPIGAILPWKFGTPA